MKYIKQGLIRGIIPIAIMGGISLIMKAQNFDSFQVKSTFLSGLIVGIVLAASVIYDIESWSLLKQTVVHIVAMLVTVFPILLISGWFPINSVADFFKFLGIYALSGLVLWSLGYLIFGKLLNKKA